MALGRFRKKRPLSGLSGKLKKSFNKFGAQRVGEFGSKTEAARFLFLQRSEKRGTISDLIAHPVYIITPLSWPIIKMIPDAQYIDVTGEWSGVPGKTIIEDTKGMVTDVFKLKVKMFHGMFPTIGIFMVKAMFRTGRIVAWKYEDIIPVRARTKRVLEQINS